MAARRVHRTTREVVTERFQQERPHLGALPHRPFDIAEKAWRKVYKDCQIAFGGNRYVVAHECVGHKVLLKVLDGMVRIYRDEELVVVYRISPGKGHTVADPKFYARLKADREQQRRKYHRWLARARRPGDC